MRNTVGKTVFFVVSGERKLDLDLDYGDSNIVAGKCCREACLGKVDNAS